MSHLNHERLFLRPFKQVKNATVVQCGSKTVRFHGTNRTPGVMTLGDFTDVMLRANRPCFIFVIFVSWQAMEATVVAGQLRVN